MITDIIIALVFTLIGIVVGWKFSATISIDEKVLISSIEKDISEIKAKLATLK